MFFPENGQKLIENNLFCQFSSYLETFGRAQPISSDLPKIGQNGHFDQHSRKVGKCFFVESGQKLIKNYLFSHFSSYLEPFGRAQKMSLNGPAFIVKKPTQPIFLRLPEFGKYVHRIVRPRFRGSIC